MILVVGTSLIHLTGVARHTPGGDVPRLPHRPALSGGGPPIDHKNYAQELDVLTYLTDVILVLVLVVQVRVPGDC